MSGPGEGAFVPVVGPSGAGKDTLIRLARAELGADPRLVFVRRIVTRGADPAHEDHDTMPPAAWEAARADGRFSLSWRAHGLAYALPVAVDAAVAQGRVVVANLSRAVLHEAGLRYRRLIVVNIEAPEDLRRARVAARGREAAGAADARAGRSVALPVGLPVVTIVNDGRPETAAARLVAVLREELSRGGTAARPLRGA